MLAWLHINTDPINLRKPIHPNKMERMEGILSHEGQCSQRMLRNTMLSGVDLPSPFLSSSSSSSYASTLARDKAPYDKYAHSYTLGVGASCRNMMRPSSSRSWMGQTLLWSVAVTLVQMSIQVEVELKMLVCLLLVAIETEKLSFDEVHISGDSINLLGILSVLSISCRYP